MSNTERAEFERVLANEVYGGMPELISDHWDSVKGEYKLFQHQAAWIAWQAARRAPVVGDIADFITGMSVSVDVSTGDHDSGNRFFGTVTEVMEESGDKHGITLLVQNAEPNFVRAPVVPRKDEQSVFEDWLECVCPSGDGTEVQRQWESSSDYLDWLAAAPRPPEPQ